MKPNPILLEVFKNRYSSIAEEMGVALMRTAFSANIKERRDFSCAIFDSSGEMIAQAAHIPVHLGAMPLSVKAAISATDMAPGDMVALNDPFMGGTHLPDITLVAPVYAGGPAFYVANRAHHADVGGMSAGSMPLARSVFQEGVIIPPIKIVEKEVLNPTFMKLFLNNVRTPAEREGDFAAQIVANATGIRRLKELIEKYGLAAATDYARALMNYAEAMTRAAINGIPDGAYRFEDVLDDDGFGSGPVPIRVCIEICGDEAKLDFSESAVQVRGALNAVRAITVSAVLYVFRALIEQEIPTNAGCLQPLKIITRPGTVVDAEFPAAVAAGNVETSQRIVDVVLGALAKAMPESIPAASQGTMNNVAIGGYDPFRRRPFAYYETLGGGTGACAGHPGAHAVHSHMTNTLNTPVEALEFAYPFRVTEYQIRKATGGAGKHAGGDGLIREILLLSDAEVTVLSERRRNGPYGLLGGHCGTPGKNLLIRKENAADMPGKFHAELSAGDIVRIETPGGGGYGGR